MASDAERIVNTLVRVCAVPVVGNGEITNAEPGHNPSLSMLVIEQLRLDLESYAGALL